MRGWLIGLALALFALPASAAVKSSSPSGFELASDVTVKAAPAAVWKALIVPSLWWNRDHSWTGEAKNLHLDARAGGCFCETLKDGGSALHMGVVYVEPGKTLRLRGALGPLTTEAVEGPMTWSIAPAGTGSKITLTYAVGGRFREGGPNWAPAVDGVLLEQLTRLARYLDTGSPAAPKP